MTLFFNHFNLKVMMQNAFLCIPRGIYYCTNDFVVDRLMSVFFLQPHSWMPFVYRFQYLNITIDCSGLFISLYFLHMNQTVLDE